MPKNRFAAGRAPASEAATHEPVLSTVEGPALLLSEVLPALLAETFPHGARKPRGDGFTPEAIGLFLHDLAVHGIVELAAPGTLRARTGDPFFSKSSASLREPRFSLQCRGKRRENIGRRKVRFFSLPWEAETSETYSAPGALS